MYLTKIKKVLLDPRLGLPILILFIFILPLFLTFIFKKNYIFYIITLLIILLVIEIAFNFLHRLINGQPYRIPKKIPFKSLHIEPHPHLTYIYKKNFYSPPAEEARYPLNKGKYQTCALKTNNLKFFNGYNGNREIKLPKPEGLFRINCLGASTTQNYISFEDKNYSYPMELEKILKEKLKKNVEVNNCGQGGYTSADILIRFLLQIVDTKPDVIVIYHAYADVRSYLTENFYSDYSHSRKNLGENYWKLKLGSMVPKFPFNFINYLNSHWLPFNTRLSLDELVHKSRINDLKLSNDFTNGLMAYKRNIQFIIDVCEKKKIKVILSTFCHFLHTEVKNEPLHKLYNEIIDEENKIMRELADKNNLKLVDNAKLLPLEEKYFVDTVHFSHEGMKKLAENFSKEF